MKKKGADKIDRDLLEKKHIKSLNDGMNTPVPDKYPKDTPSASEAALIKQAENPLGDPDKI